MKTDRLTLLIAPADKAAIAARAFELGLSVSELVRRATEDYDPGLADERVRLEALFTEAEAALARIDANLDAMLGGFDDFRATMAWQASDAYREQVRRDVLADPSINWEHVRSLLAAGGAAMAKAA